MNPGTRLSPRDMSHARSVGHEIEIQTTVTVDSFIEHGYRENITKVFMKKRTLRISFRTDTHDKSEVYSAFILINGKDCLYHLGLAVFLSG